VSFETKDGLVATAEVEHGVEPDHNVGAMIVETRCSENQIQSRREISRLQVLPLFDGLASGVGLKKILENEVSIAEIHGGSNAELKMPAQAKLAQYANDKAKVVSVLVGSDVGCHHRSVFPCKRLRSDVHEFHVLHMRPDDHAEVERSQVGVRSIFHFPFLCHRRSCNHQQAE
jgi:hypothetical protein